MTITTLKTISILTVILFLYYVITCTVTRYCRIMLIMFSRSMSESIGDEEARINKHEHAKFLLYQVQQDLNMYKDNKDCIVQCEDGSYHTSSIVLLGISPILGSFCLHIDDPVIVVPSLELGELLLFFKYVFTNKIEEMFNKEDIVVIEKVSKLLNTDIFMKAKDDNNEIIIGNTEKLLDHSENSNNNLNEDDVTNQSHNPTIMNDTNDKKAFRNKRNQQQEKLKSTVLCPFCNESFGFSLMSKHVKQKHSEKENDCLICKQSLGNKEELENHVQIHREEVNMFYLNCERCDHICLSQYQLQMHKKSHNIKKFESMACQFCDRVFQVKDKFNKHLEMHRNGELDKTLDCPYCDKQFKKQFDLKRHIKSHFGVKSHKCDICGQQFVDGTRLKQHKWVHNNVKTFKCPDENCDQAFRHKSHLKSHIASFHPNCDKLSSKLECNLCNKVFAYDYKLKQHLKWHQMDRLEKIECDDAEYSIMNMNIVETM